MKKNLLLIVAAIGLLSCGQDKGVLSEKKMAAILKDIHMTDGVFNTFRYSQNNYQNIDSVYLYKAAFERNKVTRDEFVRSLQYYAKYPKKMDKIYTMVVNDLSAYQQDLKEAYEQELKKAKDSKGGDTTTVKQPKALEAQRPTR